MSQNIQELEQRFGEAQQAAVDTFKNHLKKAFDESMSVFYTDVVNYAATDAHTNYHNYLRDEFRNSFIKEITTQYGHYSWAHSIRMEILAKHRDVLQNKIISDLEEKIESLKNEINQIYERRL